MGWRGVRDYSATVSATLIEQQWHALPAEVVLHTLGTSQAGLSLSEAQARLRQFGPNRLTEIPPPHPLSILLHQFQSPLILTLLIATLMAGLLGKWIDASVILVAILINAVFGFIQEWRAESAIRSLTRYLTPKARVIRDGTEQLIDSTQLVPGDIVILESGVRVPADLRLLQVTSLLIDESVLTGESVPVPKQTSTLPEDTVLADRANMAYLGTIVTSGRGRGVVVATGAQTEVGRIAALAQREPSPSTPLQQQLSRFARTITLAVLVAVTSIAVLGFWHGNELSTVITFAIGAAVAIIPEALPVILTIVLAVSVQRMARRRALVRYLPAVETLGSTTVIGSDKTGTLTENRMTARLVWAAGEEHEIHSSPSDLAPGTAPPKRYTSPEEVFSQAPPQALVLLTGTLANEAYLVTNESGVEHSIGDPTDIALLYAAKSALAHPEQLREHFPYEAVLPFEPDLRYMAAIRRLGNERILFAKGAPERIFQMCTQWRSPNGLVPLHDPQPIEYAAANLAQRGYRVLAFAAGTLPAHAGEEVLRSPSNLIFFGLIALWDPPRPSVKQAVAACHAAGIRVLMITGDHAGTAAAIAAELGIAPRGAAVLTGRELAQMDDTTLREQVRQVNVFARVEPEQKLRIVRALQALGETVAVTGDGVNDAPALRAADVGVAMGLSGTDVSREAADIVLTDDNFTTIVAAVEEGRGASDNLRKATFFLISTGAATLFTLPTALFLGWPLPFYPAQLIWLNVVTNGAQDVALAVEPKEPNLMRRQPRPRHEGILSHILWERTLLSGLVMAVGTLWIFDRTLTQYGSVDLARTVALTTLVLFQNFHVGNARSTTRSVFTLSPLANHFLLLAVLAALTLHIGALYTPFLQFVLRVEPIPLELWPLILVTSLCIIVVIEIHKWLRRRWPYRSWELTEFSKCKYESALPGDPR